MDINIREAEPNDAAMIAGYNSCMAIETEGRSLDRDLIAPGVEAVLTDPSKGRYWVAEVDGKTVGQLMVTYEWSDWRNGRLWWIQSVYVHREHRRKGVFSALFRHVKSLARKDPEVCGIRLYVEEENLRAQQTYLELGMDKPGYLVMEVDFRKDSE
ncbi:MAG: GNAT family N-acetyltransferase [Woeseia sp.]